MKMVIILMILLGLYQGCVAQSTAASDLVITDPSIVYTIGSATSITFDLTLTATGAGEAVNGVKVYFANVGSTVKTDPMVDATGTTTASAGDTTMTGIVAAMQLDATNCAVYTRLCALITTITPATETCTDFGTSAGQAGTTNCDAPSTAASTLSITSPTIATLEYTTTAATSITFDLILVPTGGGLAVTGVQVYFANPDSSVKTDPVVDATAGNTASAGDTTMTGIIALMQLDATNCDVYTKLCALITTTPAATETCADFGTGSGNAGTKATCPSTAASAMTITDPADISTIEYTTTAATIITFGLTLAPTGGGVAITGVKVYFTSADSSVKTNPMVDATGTTTALADATSMSGIIAEMILDETNCDAYTKLCALITTDPAATETCADFGTSVGQAGTKTCPASTAASALTITSPATTAINYTTTAATSITFDLTLTPAAGGVAVSGVKVYFSEGGSTPITSTAVDATGTQTAAVGATSMSGIIAEMILDEENCDAYTKLCALITTDPAAGETCADFGIEAENAGTKTCPASENGTENHKGHMFFVWSLAITTMVFIIRI